VRKRIIAKSRPSPNYGPHASQSTCAVCNAQHNSVLSVKRTRTDFIPSSKTCSAQSKTLPWTPHLAVLNLRDCDARYSDRSIRRRKS
jgi:hypothetical protein